MTTDCQAKPPCNPDGTLRSIKDRTDLAAVHVAYVERAVTETCRALAEFRAGTPNAGHILSFSRGTHEATRAMMGHLQAQIMVLRHVVEVQRRDADAVIAALSDRVARLEKGSDERRAGPHREAGPFCV